MSWATCIIAAEALGESTVELTGETFHHLFRARRLAVGARLRLVDGRGSARWGRVERVASRSATIRLGEPAAANEAALRLEIWVAVPRSRRAAWLVEKATEVGVSAVRWIDTDRAGREMTSAHLERLRRVAAAAVEQCHRARVPEIGGPLAWSEVVGRVGVDAPAWFLDSAAGESRFHAADGSGAVLLVGPEGGWTEVERSDLAAAGALAFSLGSRVLRVETAAVVGAALALCR